ncbi:MAG: hypothetical protein NC920_05365 [Candidatus Omnitrophica bacterium]|nr:hypothetical protein [Candidatus Omnitrophota bacterium]MCM8798778.1 hypothetical protein [Candidatus Omnitrophota bacterium]
MKMVMVVYNEAIEEMVMEVMEKCGLKNYTKITEVYGRGNTSGIHLGNDVWPGRNNLLCVACEDKESGELILGIKELRKKFGHEGVKAFVLPLEEIT